MGKVIDVTTQIMLGRIIFLWSMLSSHIIAELMKEIFRIEASSE